MTAAQPNVNAASRYSTVQASALLGVHRNTLRRYADEGLIKCGYSAANARRFYTGSEILRFWNAHLF